jgi:hypothetical protein
LNRVSWHRLEQSLQNEQIDFFVSERKAEVAANVVTWPVSLIK